MTNPHYLFVLLSTLLCWPYTAGVAASKAPAPLLGLERVDNGQLQTLDEYIGKGSWVIVNVWSPDCSFCVQELPTLERFGKANPEVKILGVTIDFPSFGRGKRDRIEAFLTRHPLPFTLFIADRKEASIVIGRRLVGIPLIAIFHPDGRPIARWPGIIEPDEIIKIMQDPSRWNTSDSDDFSF